MEVKGLAMLVSGGGTTMEAILKALGRESPLSKFLRPTLVIASLPGIGAIERARKQGMDEDDIVVLTCRGPELSRRILEEARKRDVEYIGQYGFLPKTYPVLIDAYKKRMVNQHPGCIRWQLPPGYDFGGKGMYGARVTAARKYFCDKVGRDFFTEATAQFVDAEYDRGPVFCRREVHFEPGESVDDIKKRLLVVEHEVQVDALFALVHASARPLKDPAPIILNQEEKRLLDQAKARAFEEYPNG